MDTHTDIFFFAQHFHCTKVNCQFKLIILASWFLKLKSLSSRLYKESNVTKWSNMTCRGWIRYMLPAIFLFIAILMLWRRHFNKGKPLETFKVTSPPNRNTVEQFLTLQEVITQVEALIQAGNIILLKTRALLFGVLPQVHILTMLYSYVRKTSKYWILCIAQYYSFLAIEFLRIRGKFALSLAFSFSFP